MLQLRFPLDLGTWDAYRRFFTERAYCEQLCVSVVKCRGNARELYIAELDSNALR